MLKAALRCDWCWPIIPSSLLDPYWLSYYEISELRLDWQGVCRRINSLSPQPILLSKWTHWILSRYCHSVWTLWSWSQYWYQFLMEFLPFTCFEWRWLCACICYSAQWWRLYFYPCWFVSLLARLFHTLQISRGVGLHSWSASCSWYLIWILKWLQTDTSCSKLI